MFLKNKCFNGVVGSKSCWVFDVPLLLSAIGLVVIEDTIEIMECLGLRSLEEISSLFSVT
jgi:hypothetical protein